MRDLRSRLSPFIQTLKNRNLSILLITWVLFSLTRPLFYQFESDYVNRLGASPEIIGLMGSSVVLVSMLIQIPGGYLADKRGRKNLIVWGTFLLAFPNFVKALTGSWRVYFLASILATLINSLYSPALHALFQDSLPKDARGFSSSLIDGISWVIPSVFSLFFGGYLYERYGLHGLKMSLFLISISYLVSGVLRCALTETLVKSEVNKPDIYPFREFFSSLKRVFEWAYRSIGYLLMIEALFGIIRGLVGSFWVLYALRVIGIKKIEYGALQAIYNIVYFPLSLYGGRLSDKRGRIRQMRYVPLLWAVSNLIFIKATGFSMILLSYLISLLGEAFWWPALDALWIDVVPRSKRARISSVRSIVFGISSSIASAMGGLLYARSPAYPFFFVVVVDLLFTPVMLVIREPKEREE